MIEKDVDICITTYNKKNSLIKILHMLSNQTNMNFNLIINDDGSKDLINPNEYPIITKYIWNPDIAYNRVGRFNESILICVSPYIIILDDDAIPVNNNFIQSHIDCLKKADFSSGRITFGKNYDIQGGWFSTANLGFRKTIIHNYGLFYPEYDGHYGYEDYDLGEEIKQRKLSVCNNTVGMVNMTYDMYLNGDRSDKIVKHNKDLLIKRWGPSAAH